MVSHEDVTGWAETVHSLDLAHPSGVRVRFDNISAAVARGAYHIVERMLLAAAGGQHVDVNHRSANALLVFCLCVHACSCAI